MHKNMLTRLSALFSPLQTRPVPYRQTTAGLSFSDWRYVFRAASSGCRIGDFLFMSKKMLIDAAHPEETRIAVLEGNRVEEFDFESHHRKQISANIYLAKITRVEPALQAAFVDFGGDRHGFLAFNEIHPDYYQIPFEDRQALLQETQEAEKADETDSDPDTSQASDEEDETSEEDAQELAKRARRYHNPALRKYKIQEVIKRRQIMLVQVVKEERGNKGAALTTYLSLAGRYCVLMPNTPRGVGVSRKITQASDRTRLKKLANNLEVSEGMGLIIRTAGSRRTQAEIRRDYEYLLRLWEKICEETLTSIAPVLIYEEGDLVKRAIRDLYDKHIEKVLVEGDEAYKNAKNFIRMLMPSHAKKIQPYRENTPLFLQYGIENDLDILHTPTVPLKSGGYLVINATEALIAIDVNSGRSTRERNIENTALKTNLEAVEETTRQMRLRDLAGLIVIDFIDMKDHKNNRMVEKKMREHLKKDRARVQMGRISSFGLMELSRQRRRRSVLEGSSEKCPSCQGYGRIRSIASSTLHALRALEEEGLRQKSSSVQLSVPKNVAFYLLNEKREALHHLQERLNLKAVIISDDNLTRPDFILTPLQKRKKTDKTGYGGRENIKFRSNSYREKACAFKTFTQKIFRQRECFQERDKHLRGYFPGD